MFYNNSEITLDDIEAKLKAHKPDPAHPHDEWVMIALEEAIVGARDGNFAVGAILINADGEVVIRGHNEMFHPYFRSDMHGEMNVITMFEEQYKNFGSVKDFTLVTTLESCPMCVVREITAGIGTILHAAPDVESGMACTLDRLTQVWYEMSKRQTFAEADCSLILKELCMQAWLVTANANQTVVKGRS